MNKWDLRFIELARTVGSWSKDPKRKVGCVLVYPGMHKFSLGYNGIPRGIEDSASRVNDQAVKNAMTVHAELNAILNARADVTDCAAYITSSPCLDCCKAMIQAGIGFVTCPSPDKTSTWHESQQFGLNLLHEAGVNVVHYDEDFTPEPETTSNDCCYDVSNHRWNDETASMWCAKCKSDTRIPF